MVARLESHISIEKRMLNFVAIMRDTDRGIEWSLRACEQSVYFCEHEHLTSSCKNFASMSKQAPI